MVECVPSAYRLIVLCNLNGWIGLISGAGIRDEFGEENINDNRRKMLDMCRDTSKYVINMYIKYNCVHKYAWYRTGTDINVRSLIDYITARK